MSGLFRFMIVEHPVTQWHKGPVCIHNLLNDYHWEMLTTTHVLLAGYYPAIHHGRLDNHEKCLLMPSIGTGKTLIAHAKERGKEAFLSHLALLNPDETWTTQTLAQAVAKWAGVKFELTL